MRWTLIRWTEGRRALRGQAVTPMLTALGIAAASAGLIAPWLGSRQQDMARARSMSNLKVLTRATQMYMADWGGTFPGWQRNPDGNFAHNVWDQQIFPYVGRNDVYFNGQPLGIRSVADPRKQRVLSYGLNGLLLCTPAGFSGSVRQQMFANEKPQMPPALRSVRTVRNPADTILFAELATQAVVAPYWQNFNQPYVPNQAPNGSPAWNAALTHWIDISPREWVETSITNESRDSYDPARWDPTRGIARALYGGGGNYAFVDGHVEFQTIGETVGLGKTINIGPANVTIIPGYTAWLASNYYNQWNPMQHRPSSGRDRGFGVRWPVK